MFHHHSLHLVEEKSSDRARKLGAITIYGIKMKGNDPEKEKEMRAAQVAEDQRVAELKQTKLSLMNLLGSKMGVLKVTFTDIQEIANKAMELLDAVKPEHVILFANDTEAETPFANVCDWTRANGESRYDNWAFYDMCVEGSTSTCSDTLAGRRHRES
eukprot:SAG22_NODE_161_length_16908_cov_39.687965_22_plen_158_part_00